LALEVQNMISDDAKGLSWVLRNKDVAAFKQRLDSIRGVITDTILLSMWYVCPPSIALLIRRQERQVGGQ